MNVADLLNYSDMRQLGKISVRYDCECNLHSKHDMIQSILQAMNKRGVFEKMVASMELTELRFVYSLLFDERETYSLEELTARVQHAKFDLKQKGEQKDGGTPREIIAEFKQRGWLFNGYAHHTKFLFHVPDDIRRRLSGLMMKRLMNDIVCTDRPHGYREEHDLICGDIRTFLTYLYQEEVPLTAEGTMYKRNLSQIVDLLAVREMPVQKGEWRFGYGRRFKEYPDRLSLIYDYCYAREWIVENPNFLELTEAGKRVVQEKISTSPHDLFAFWMKLYRRPIKHLQATVKWLAMLSEEWVTLSSLKQVLLPFILPYYYDDAEAVLQRRIIQMLVHQGLLRIGEETRQGAVLQTTALGQKLILSKEEGLGERTFIKRQGV